MPLRVNPPEGKDKWFADRVAEGMTLEQANNFLYGIGQIMMVLGADKLTVENFPKYAMRLRVWQTLHGAAGFIDGKLVVLGDAWLEPWIGTSINGMPESDASWNKRMFNDGVMEFTRKWRKDYDNGKRLTDVPEVPAAPPADELSGVHELCEGYHAEGSAAVQPAATEHIVADGGEILNS